MVSFRYGFVIKVQEQVLLTLCAGHAPESNIARPSLSSACFVGAHSTTISCGANVQKILSSLVFWIFFFFSAHVRVNVCGSRGGGKEVVCALPEFTVPSKQPRFLRSPKQIKVALLLLAQKSSVSQIHPALRKTQTYFDTVSTLSQELSATQRCPRSSSVCSHHPQRPEFAQPSNPPWCCSSQCMLGPC